MRVSTLPPHSIRLSNSPGPCSGCTRMPISNRRNNSSTVMGVPRSCIGAACLSSSVQVVDLATVGGNVGPPGALRHQDDVLRAVFIPHTLGQRVPGGHDHVLTQAVDFCLPYSRQKFRNQHPVLL